MLWREPFHTRAHPEFPLPDGPWQSGVLIGAASLEAFSEWELWRRLCVADLPDVPLTMAYLGEGPLESLVPASQRSLWVRVDGARWVDQIQVPMGRAFAAWVVDQWARHCYIGPPTEDVWQHFCEQAPQL